MQLMPPGLCSHDPAASAALDEKICVRNSRRSEVRMVILLLL
jgi:hypothetical protein